MQNEKSEEQPQKDEIRFQSAHSAESTQKLYLDDETADIQFTFYFDVADKWDDFRKILGRVFPTLKTWNRRLKKKVPAHKNLLSKGSSVFARMFFGSFSEQAEIEIVDVSVEAFVEFLLFFYSADVKISIENVGELMYLAEKYFVPVCMELCEDVIAEHLPVANICDGYELAIKFDRIELQKRLDYKISTNSKVFFETDGFRQCSYSFLKRVLTIQNFDCDPMGVFEACMAWAENACAQKKLDPAALKNRKNMLKECFYLIPFKRMSPEQVRQCTTECSELFERNELLQLINIMAPGTPNTNLLQNNCLVIYSKDGTTTDRKLTLKTIETNETSQWSLEDGVFPIDARSFIQQIAVTLISFIFFILYNQYVN